MANTKSGIRTAVSLAGKVLPAVALLSCLISGPQARADFLAHRSTHAFFAKEDFSTWIPRKGKMSYERDSAQAEYGQGRKRIRQVTCAELPGFVGPVGGAHDEDIVVVTTKGTCKLKGLTVHKAVTIRPAKPVDAVVPKAVANQSYTAIAKAFPLKFDCSDAAQACITTNVAAGKTVILKNLHIISDSANLAPLVESRSGGLALDNNFIRGGVERDQEAYIVAHHQSAAVLIQGSHAKLDNNLIARTIVGILMYPTQVGPGSRYQISSNVIAQVDVGIDMTGKNFMTRRGPAVKADLLGNFINPALDDFSPSWDEERVDTETADKASPYGAIIGVPQYGVLAYGIDMTIAGNSFGTSQVHVGMFGGSNARIDQNIFRDAHSTSIDPVDGSRAFINRNLFDSNRSVVGGIGYALAAGSPVPSGNMCINQGFESFYQGPPHVTGYVDLKNGGFVFYEDEPKKISRSAIRKSQKTEPKLWAAYTSADAFDVEEKQSGPISRDAGNKSSNKSGKSTELEYMWDVFRTYYKTSQKPVVAHILFDREDVKPGDGYRGCFDYSTLFKFSDGSEHDDGFFTSANGD